MLHQEAGVLDDLDPASRQRLGRLVVDDAELEPHDSRLRGEDVGDVRRNGVRPAEHVDHVDGPGHRAHRAVDGTAEDLRHLGIVDGHGHDVVTRAGHVLGNVEGGLAALGLGLHAEDGDAARVPEDARDIFGRFDEVSPPVAHALDS